MAPAQWRVLLLLLLLLMRATCVRYTNAWTRAVLCQLAGGLQAPLHLSIAVLLHTCSRLLTHRPSTARASCLRRSLFPSLASWLRGTSLRQLAATMALLDTWAHIQSNPASQRQRTCLRELAAHRSITRQVPEGGRHRGSQQRLPAGLQHLEQGGHHAQPAGRPHDVLALRPKDWQFDISLAGQAPRPTCRRLAGAPSHASDMRCTRSSSRGSTGTT